MKRTDCLNIESCRFLKKRLNLSAVLSNYTYIITSCLASPVFLNIKRAELSESVGGEKNLVLAVIGNDNLGPVNHRSRYEIQNMLAEFKCISFFYNNSSVLKLSAEEVLHHIKSLLARNNYRVGIIVHKIHNIGAVVGLHMLNHKIIGLSAI